MIDEPRDDDTIEMDEETGQGASDEDRPDEPTSEPEPTEPDDE